MPFKRILKGYKSFHKDYFRSGSKLYADLAENGQKPDTLVIACSDSRTDPAIVMNSKPGELFVVRNVAAIVPPYKCDSLHHGTSAAIEFAVRTLKVKHVIVMGHSLCGGIQALDKLEDFRQHYEFLPQWVEVGITAREKVNSTCAHATPEERSAALEQGVVLVSLKNLMTFPWLRDEVEAGRIDLHGLHLDLTNGKLLQYNPSDDKFHPMGTKNAG